MHTINQRPCPTAYMRSPTNVQGSQTPDSACSPQRPSRQIPTDSALCHFVRHASSLIMKHRRSGISDFCSASVHAANFFLIQSMHPSKLWEHRLYPPVDTALLKMDTIVTTIASCTTGKGSTKGDLVQTGKCELNRIDSHYA